MNGVFQTKIRLISGYFKNDDTCKQESCTNEKLNMASKLEDQDQLQLSNYSFYCLTQHLLNCDRYLMHMLFNVVVLPSCQHKVLNSNEKDIGYQCSSGISRN